MKIKELYNYLDERISPLLSEEWDNDGKMLISSDKEVKKVLITLDVTPEAIKEAVSGGYDLMLTHHPMIFKPIKGITDEKFLSLIKADISVFSFHTRLDSVEGGVNDALAALLGLENTLPFEVMGRVGELKEEMNTDDFAVYVKNTLGCDTIGYTKGKNTVKKVALLGGGGKDFWKKASEISDAYITGEMSYNTMLDAHENSFTVIEAGHYFTEFPVCSVLFGMVKGADPEIEAKIFNFYPVKSI